DLADDVDIPARLDLHLDALVAVVELVLDLVEQLLHGILNADGDAARDFATRAGPDLLPERDAGAPGIKIPDGGFKAAASHVVAANVGGQRVHVLGRSNLAA